MACPVHTPLILKPWPKALNAFLLWINQYEISDSRLTVQFLASLKGLFFEYQHIHPPPPAFSWILCCRSTIWTGFLACGQCLWSAWTVRVSRMKSATCRRSWSPRWSWCPTLLRPADWTQGAGEARRFFLIFFWTLGIVSVLWIRFCKICVHFYWNQNILSSWLSSSVLKMPLELLLWRWIIKSRHGGGIPRAVTTRLTAAPCGFYLNRFHARHGS